MTDDVTARKPEKDAKAYERLNRAIDKLRFGDKE